MTASAKAIAMWVVACLLIIALLANIQLREIGEAYRPLHILLCGPLALYCAIRGSMFWLEK
jgi:hypothetical protein